MLVHLHQDKGGIVCSGLAKVVCISIFRSLFYSVTVFVVLFTFQIPEENHKPNAKCKQHRFKCLQMLSELQHVLHAMVVFDLPDIYIVFCIVVSGVYPANRNVYSSTGHL